MARLAIYQGCDNDTMLVTGSETGSVTFWNVNQRVRNGAQATSNGHSRKVTGVDASSSGLTVATVGLDGQTMVWSGRACKLLYSLAPYTSPINSVTFLPKLDAILTSAWDGSVRKTSVATKTSESVSQEGTSVQAVAVSNHKTAVLSMGRLTAYHDGKQIWCHRVATDAAALAMDSEGEDVFVFSGCMILRFSGDQGESRGCYDGIQSHSVLGIFLLEADRMMVASRGGQVKIIDLKTAFGQSDNRDADGSKPVSLAVHDGYIFKLTSGGQLFISSLEANTSDGVVILLKSGRRYVKVQAISRPERDAKHVSLAISTQDGSIERCDWEKGQSTLGYTYPGRAISFSNLYKTAQT